MSSKKSVPYVVLVGRVNVGKSTLFNIITGEKSALTSPIPGTTRDYKEAICQWQNRIFTLVDTGGFAVLPSEPLQESITRQSLQAIDKADVILFVVDGATDPLPDDKRIAALLQKKAQKKSTPVILVINKVDSQRQENHLSPDFYTLRFSETALVSSTNGRGTGDLLDQLAHHLPAVSHEPVSGTRIAFLGRPNVGKSSLVNALLGAERVLVYHEPHTTRDTQWIPFLWQKKPFTLIDTAGISQKKKILKNSHLKSGGKLEELAIAESLRIAVISDVLLFVVDVAEPLSGIDRRIADIVNDAQKPVLIIANKWDRLENKESQTLPKVEKKLRDELPNMHNAPILSTSATDHLRVQNIMRETEKLLARTTVQVAAEDLERIVLRLQAHLATAKKPLAHALKVLGLEQEPGNTLPTFVVHVSARTRLHDAVVQRIHKDLRNAADFRGIPIRLYISHGKQ